MSMNNCNYNSCYGPFRTEFDRMMQRKHGNGMCQPSAKLVCDGSGNAVLETDAQDKRQAAFEAFRISRAHRARQIALSRAKAQARRRPPVRRRRRGRENFEGPSPNGKGNGNGKGKAMVLTQEWCGFCNKLQKEMNKIKGMLDDKGIDVHVPPDEEAKKHAEEHGLRGFPAVVVFDDDGNVSGTFTGFKPADGFVEEIMAHLPGGAKHGSKAK